MLLSHYLIRCYKLHSANIRRLCTVSIVRVPLCVGRPCALCCVSLVYLDMFVVCLLRFRVFKFGSLVYLHMFVVCLLRFRVFKFGSLVYLEMFVVCLLRFRVFKFGSLVYLKAWVDWKPQCVGRLRGLCCRTLQLNALVR